MTLALWLSRLGSGPARRAATRALGLFSLLGFLVTMTVLGATGRGSDRWFFVLVVWLALVFLPLWLLLQMFQTMGPGLQRRLTVALRGRDDRYGRASSATLLVEDLFHRHVVLPRIATPLQKDKAREAAAALVISADRLTDADAVIRTSLLRSLAAIDAWVRSLPGWASAEAADNIQARWQTVRALAALAAFARAVLAVYEDRLGQAAALSRLDGQSLQAFVDNALDFCDELALEVEVPSWSEPPLLLNDEAADAGELRRAWQEYADATPPASHTLRHFLVLLTSA